MLPLIVVHENNKTLTCVDPHTPLLQIIPNALSRTLKRLPTNAFTELPHDEKLSENSVPRVMLSHDIVHIYE